MLGWWRIVWLPSGCDKGAMTGGCCCWSVGLLLLLLWMSWLESLPSCSELASDFNTAFSRSKTEFLSYSSLMCSFNTSTSSRTAYIRWLFTKSWTEKINFNTREIQSLLLISVIWSWARQIWEIALGRKEKQVSDWCTVTVSANHTHHRLLNLVVDGNNAGTGCAVGERGKLTTSLTEHPRIPSSLDPCQHFCIQQSGKSASW